MLGGKGLPRNEASETQTPAPSHRGCVPSSAQQVWVTGTGHTLCQPLRVRAQTACTLPPFVFSPPLCRTSGGLLRGKVSQKEVKITAMKVQCQLYNPGQVTELL